MDKKLSENMPIYVQIMNSVKEAIAAGELAPSSRVPSVRELARDFEVNPNTMQRALSALESGGLIFSERTTGRFVTNNLELIRKAKEALAKANVENFFSSMAELGYSNDDAISMANELKR